MKGWKKAQLDYNKEPCFIQLTDWKRIYFKDFDEYYKYIKGGIK